MKTRKSLRTKGLAIGIGVSAIVIGIFVARLDWFEFRQAITQVRWPWVLAGCFAILASITLRAVRWLGISGARRGQIAAYWNSTVIGYVGNILYPGRAGELLRIAALHHATRNPPGELMTKALMDRMADVVFLGLAALYVAGVATTRIGGNRLLAWMIVIIIVPLCTFVAFLILGARLKPLVYRSSAVLPGLWRERVPRWYGQMLEACAELVSPRRLAWATVFTLAAYGADYTMLWLFLRAFDWQLPLNAAMTMSVLLAMGSLVPAAPGYIGVYQAACVIALAAYDISESSALAYSVVAQGSTILVTVLLGTVVAARYGMGFGMVRGSQ